jgi:hypothetical protein
LSKGTPSSIRQQKKGAAFDKLRPNGRGELLPRRPRDDRQRVHPLDQQILQRRINRPLPSEAGLAGETRRLHFDREVALGPFPAIAAMAAMLLAVVAHDEPCRLQGSRQPRVDFGRYRPGELASISPI